MTPPQTERQDRWDASYQRRENFVFAPSEQLVRFISRYVRRRIGLDEFADILPPPIRLLDLGCGIGRHVVFAQEMNLEAHGIDLSPVAIGIARDWLARRGCPDPAAWLHVGSVTQLPFADAFFQVAVSHGVLDSMSFEIADQAAAECDRVLCPGGLFYCDLISADDAKHGREFAGEETVTTPHERDTIQSYFNFTKIQKLFAGRFDILEAVLVKTENLLAPVSHARNHLVLKKR